jgi:WD40 repeat protein
VRSMQTTPYTLHFISVLTLLVLGLAGPATIAQQARERQALNLEITRRVNAHGNEFNALAKSSDSKRLFVATEKGDIIVWDVAMRRAERTLHQPGPVHLIAALADTGEIIAAGSSHHKPVNSLVRKWNVNSGTYVDLTGLDADSFPSALAVSTDNSLVGVTTMEGTVAVWDLGTNKQIATWKLKETPSAIALVGRTAYVGTIDRDAILSEKGTGESAIRKFNIDDPKQESSDFLRVRDRMWLALNPSPDNRLLSVTYESPADGRTIIFDMTSKAEKGSFGGGASTWIDKSKLMLFNWMDPAEIIATPANGPATSIRKLERMQADTRGRAFDLTGQVTNSNGSKAWATYRKGPGLLEFDLATNKITTLIQGPSGAYAISANTRNADEGEVLTGGADGYVRLWKLADLSLIKEFQVAAQGYFVTDAFLLADSQRAVVNVMEIPKEYERNEHVDVLLVNLETGVQKKLIDLPSWSLGVAAAGDEIIYPEGDRITFTSVSDPQKKRELKLGAPILRSKVSENGRWLAAFDSQEKLTVIDLTTSKTRTIPIGEGGSGATVVANDGQYVYQIGHEGELTKWNINTGQVQQSVLSRIREMHSNVDFITLSEDDKWLVTAGNHGDVGVFDSETGRLLFYVQTASAAFYVEKVWLKGNRILITTDSGVMLAGKLGKSAATP